MNYDHVTNKEVREILNGTVECGPEELEFTVRSTLDAWAQDNSPPVLAYINVNDLSYQARKECIDIIHENWGDGDDGNSITLQACRNFWMA